MLAIERATPKPGSDGLRLQARNEAEVFAKLVWQGFMTEEEALDALSIPPGERALLEEFAAQQSGPEARDIRKVIQLRDLAVDEFTTLISSDLCQR
jgi:hypothetical protein